MISFSLYIISELKMYNNRLLHIFSSPLQLLRKLIHLNEKGFMLLHLFSIHIGSLLSNLYHLNCTQQTELTV